MYCWNPAVSKLHVKMLSWYNFQAVLDQPAFDLSVILWGKVRQGQVQLQTADLHVMKATAKQLCLVDAVWVRN